jgi:hypothetical protein
LRSWQAGGDCLVDHTIERYLLDPLRNRLGFPETVMAVKAMTKKRPKPT